MSAAGEAKDARVSRAKPWLEERVCEDGWRPTRDLAASTPDSRRAHRRARRRAIARRPTLGPLVQSGQRKEAEE